MKMHLVFLPATGPGDESYGAAPRKIEGRPEALCHEVRYSELVWYNKRVRDEAIAQIRAFDISPVVLVGFSKSGLGAWNIARTIPDLVSGTIIFDAPVASDARPSRDTSPFYRDDVSWQADLPLRCARDFQEAMPKTHRLVLISGPGFHDEMCRLSDELSTIGLRHAFLLRPQLKHHWNSGWIEEGLNKMGGRTGGAAARKSAGNAAP